MFLENPAISAVIGVHGSRIQHIRAVSGCQIFIEPYTAPTLERKISLKGCAISVEIAKAMIERVIKEDAEAKANSNTQPPIFNENVSMVQAQPDIPVASYGWSDEPLLISSWLNGESANVATEDTHVAPINSMNLNAHN